MTHKGKNQHVFNFSEETLVTSDWPTITEQLCIGQGTEHPPVES